MPASETNSKQRVSTNIYLLKVKNINARKKREIKIVNFQYTSHLSFPGIYIVDFEDIFVRWGTRKDHKHTKTLPRHI